MHYVFRWYFWPPHGLASISDEFCVGLLCLRLLGNLLIVGTEAPTQEEAAVAAQAIKMRYSEALSKYTGFPACLITLDELSARPAEAITTTSPSLEECRRLATAVRKARTDLLAGEHEQLRRCYDYLQDARENEENTLFYLYKLIETVEDFFGTERKACNALGVNKDLKFVKRLANKSSYDERHAPKLHEPLKQLSPEDRAAAIESTRRVLRAFERHLRQ